MIARVRSVFKKILFVVAISILCITGAFACGKSQKDAIFVGSIDPVLSLDPAGSYDKGSWAVLNNVFAGLLKTENGNLNSELAESCASTDPLTYTCKLKQNLKFSNGDSLTSKDVKFTFDRILRINDYNGPSSLFENLSSTSTPDNLNVVFHLKEPDYPFLYKLTVTGAGIVDSKIYSPDKLLPNNKLPVGAGQYKLEHFKDKEIARFHVNDNYIGKRAITSDILIKYYSRSEQMKNDLKRGDIDLITNGLTPRDIQSMKGKQYKLTVGTTGRTDYIAFNTNAVSKAARQAVAYLIDRDSIASGVYFNTVKPQYSMISTIPGTDEFKVRYGATPSVEKAKAVMQQANIQLPYHLELWWTPSHYGPSSADEYLNIKRQLEKDRIFAVDLKSTEWSDYLLKEHNDKMQSFQIGWAIDYPNAEDELTPFFGDKPFLKLNYNNTAIRALLNKYLNPQITDQQRSSIIQQILPMVAEDAPIIPIWNQGNIVLSKANISNVAKAINGNILVNFSVLKKNG